MCGIVLAFLNVKMLLSCFEAGKQHMVYFRQSGVGGGEDENA
jgi:hypothetical protein